MGKKFLVLGFALLFQTFFVCAGPNRVVLITGTSRGVGLASAECLANNGFTVYGTIRPFTEAPLPERANLHFLSVNLTDETSIKAAVQRVLEREGRIDVLINNAGYAVVGPVESLTSQEIQDQMDVNFVAPIKFIQSVLPTMRNQKRGHILNISSTNAILTPPFGSLYAASKAALESFSESLCIEVLPYNISVSIVEPGALSTRFSIVMGTKKIDNDPYEAITNTIQSNLEKRINHPELFSFRQSSKEVAEFLHAVLQDPHPKLRYQTSEEAKKDVSLMLLDLTGDLYLDEVRKSMGN